MLQPKLKTGIDYQKFAMTVDVEKWLKEDGEVFSKEIGIKEGQVVLDFGCGVGHYTIPAAKVVGEEGKVYAVDKDKEPLEKLMEVAKSEGLEDIVPVETSGNLKLDLKDESVDVVLLYDIIHYIEGREKLFEEVHRVLKREGFLSVYPKHYRSDEPLWTLAGLELENIIEEIERAKFYLERKTFEKLIHDDSYNRGYVLNFKKR